MALLRRCIEELRAVQLADGDSLARAWHPEATRTTCAEGLAPVDQIHDPYLLVTIDSLSVEQPRRTQTMSWNNQRG